LGKESARKWRRNHFPRGLEAQPAPKREKEVGVEARGHEKIGISREVKEREAGKPSASLCGEEKNVNKKGRPLGAI